MSTTIIRTRKFTSRPIRQAELLPMPRTKLVSARFVISFLDLLLRDLYIVIKWICETKSENPGAELYLSSHSQGGALALFTLLTTRNLPVKHLAVHNSFLLDFIAVLAYIIWPDNSIGRIEFRQTDRYLSITQRKSPSRWSVVDVIVCVPGKYFFPFNNLFFCKCCRKKNRTSLLTSNLFLDPKEGVIHPMRIYVRIWACKANQSYLTLKILGLYLQAIQHVATM